MGLRKIPTNRHILHCYPLFNTKQGALFLALQKNKAPLPQALTPGLFSLICLHLHLPLFPPTFLLPQLYLQTHPFPLPPFLLLIFSLPHHLSDFSSHPSLLIVCWADVVLACVKFFPSETEVFAVREATRHPGTKEWSDLEW